MVVDIINEYRKANGKEYIFVWNPVENDYCMEHCLYMAKLQCFEHAPEHLRKGKAEAIAKCGFIIDNFTTVRYLIFNVINESQKHKDVVLNYENLAYGFYIHNYTAYLVIRGWNG